MSNKNPFKNRKHYVFIFYKDGTYKIHVLSMSSNKLAREKRNKILNFLPYDSRIKKFFVISGVDHSMVFNMKLDRELNSIGITANSF